MTINTGSWSPVEEATRGKAESISDRISRLIWALVVSAGSEWFVTAKSGRQPLVLAVWVLYGDQGFPHVNSTLRRLLKEFNYCHRKSVADGRTYMISDNASES